MAKFDYKKWVTNYKNNNLGIFEQKLTGSASTGSASTGSASTGSMSTGSVSTGSMSTGSASTGSASTGSMSKSRFNRRKLRKNPRMREQFPTGSATGSVTGSEATGSITGSCGNFGTLPSSIQLTACQAYYNLANPQSDPNLTQWVDSGNCCEGIYTGSMATGSMATGSMATGSMATGSMAQGMPSMTRRPQRRMPQRRIPTRGLREINNLAELANNLKKIINKQKRKK